jgi:hypothetical protein
MTPLRVFLAALWLTTLLAGSHIGANYAASQPITGVARSHVDTTSFLDGGRADTIPGEEGVPEDWPASRVDLNGNEIDDAVGDYRVDLRGEMYEGHAPETALPHLGAPRL